VKVLVWYEILKPEEFKAEHANIADRELLASNDTLKPQIILDERITTDTVHAQVTVTYNTIVDSVRYEMKVIAVINRITRDAYFTVPTFGPTSIV
jgi:hypothetical protein